RISTARGTDPQIRQEIWLDGISRGDSVPESRLAAGTGFQLRHVRAQRGAPRSAGRRVLYAVSVFYRQYARIAGHHHAGLFALPHHRAVRSRIVEDANQIDPGEKRPDEFHRAPGLYRAREGPANVSGST